MIIKKIGEVFQLDKELQTYLNTLNNPKNYPKEFVISKFLIPVKICLKNQEKSACAIQSINRGTVIYVNSGSRVSLPLKYTIQVEQNIHIVGPKLIDHDCEDPTCEIDINNNLVARRKVLPGEKITYNYLTTEYCLTNDFYCKCGKKNCFGLIKGFNYLSKNEKKQLKSKFRLANYLSKLI